jgi:mono/diheme cytochrome c family protein
VNLTSAPTGLAQWSVEQLAAYLKTGQNGRASTFGPMNEVIMNSTRHLSDADVRAMAVYIKSLPARADDGGSKPSEEVLRSGETLYTVHCGTCHLPTGLGSDDSAPPLAGSAVVQASDPSSLLNTIIYGPELPNPPLHNDWDLMEAFGDEMGDEELAELASYVRSAWGNSAGAVSADQVAQQR